MSDTPITPEEAIELLLQGHSEDFVLIPCTVNGEPSQVLAHVVREHPDTPDEEGRVTRYSLRGIFVAVTPEMKIVDHVGRVFQPDAMVD